MHSNGELKAGCTEATFQWHFEGWGASQQVAKVKKGILSRARKEIKVGEGTGKMAWCIDQPGFQQVHSNKENSTKGGRGTEGHGAWM